MYGSAIERFGFALEREITHPDHGMRSCPTVALARWWVTGWSDEGWCWPIRSQFDDLANQGSSGLTAGALDGFGHGYDQSDRISSGVDAQSDCTWSKDCS